MLFMLSASLYAQRIAELTPLPCLSQSKKESSFAPIPLSLPPVGAQSTISAFTKGTTVESTEVPTWLYVGFRLQDANVHALNEALRSASSPVRHYPALSSVSFGLDYGMRHWFGNILMDGTFGFAFAGGWSPASSGRQSSDNGRQSSLVSITLGTDVGYRVWSDGRFSVYPTLGIRGELQSLSFTERSEFQSNTALHNTSAQGSTTQSNASGQAMSGNWSAALASVKQTTTHRISLISSNVIPVIGIGAEYGFTWIDRKRCGCGEQSVVVERERDGVLFVHVGYMTGGILRDRSMNEWQHEGQRITDLPNAFSQGLTVRIGLGYNIARLGKVISQYSTQSDDLPATSDFTTEFGQFLFPPLGGESQHSPDDR
jgi:hypothetical protein